MSPFLASEKRKLGGRFGLSSLPVLSLCKEAKKLRYPRRESGLAVFDALDWLFLSYVVSFLLHLPELPTTKVVPQTQYMYSNASCPGGGVSAIWNGGMGYPRWRSARPK